MKKENNPFNWKGKILSVCAVCVQNRDLNVSCTGTF